MGTLPKGITSSRIAEQEAVCGQERQASCIRFVERKIKCFKLKPKSRVTQLDTELSMLTWDVVALLEDKPYLLPLTSRQGWYVLYKRKCGYLVVLDSYNVPFILHIKPQ